MSFLDELEKTISFYEKRDRTHDRPEGLSVHQLDALISQQPVVVGCDDRCRSCNANTCAFLNDRGGA